MASDVVACAGAGMGTAQRTMSNSRSKLASNLWLLPVLCVLGGVLLSLGTLVLDRWFDDR